jgi:hypothetical protein
MNRLVRGTQHILDVLDVLHQDRLALRIHDGAFSAMDRTARHPRNGELLSTVKFMVETLAAAGELQRDLQRELTYDGLRAAEAKGSEGGRRPAMKTETTDAVRAAYLGGQYIAGLARERRVSRGAIRTAVADLLPKHTAGTTDIPAPELPVDHPELSSRPRTPPKQRLERHRQLHCPWVQSWESGTDVCRLGSPCYGTDLVSASVVAAAHEAVPFPGGGVNLLEQSGEELLVEEYAVLLGRDLELVDHNGGGPGPAGSFFPPARS